MLPLVFSQEGKCGKISEIKGRQNIKKHLENLGFVPGTDISLVTSNNGNVIVNVRDARVALSKELAMKIMVEE